MKEANGVRKMMAIAVLGLAAASCTAQGAADEQLTKAKRAERGKYLVTIGGCNDCHTPFKLGPNGPEPDMTRMLSGHPQNLPMPPVTTTAPWGWTGAATNTAFAGPWGVSYAFNLTPDEHTGIGIWTEEIFMNTIRNGRHWGVGRPILPPMPWFNYREMSDEDLRSVYAYLRTIPAVRNIVPDAIVAAESGTTD
jgi:mono/diheme cytochrome c family protein